MTCPRCGSQMSAGQRFEATQTVDVLVCWSSCGYETPGLACCQAAHPRAARIKVCGHCGVEISQRAAFCSVACYAADKRKHVIVRTCPCGKAFDVPTYRLQRNDGARGGRYCSRPCQNTYRVRKGAA